LLPHSARDLQHGLPLDVDNIVKPRRMYRANPLSHSVVPITSSPLPMARSASQAGLRRSPNGNSPPGQYRLGGHGTRSTSSLPPPNKHLVYHIVLVTL
jgi:hypothetical protein